MGIFDVPDRGIAAAVTRRLGMTALGLSLDPDLNISIDPQNYPEMQWHIGWRRWALGFFTLTPPAGQIVRCQLRNPDPPGRLVVVIESIYFAATQTSDFWNIGILGNGPGIADLSTVIPGASPCDGRIIAGGAPSQGALIFSEQAQAPTLSRATGQLIHEFVPLVANTGSGSGAYVQMLNLPIVMMPGNALFWENGGVTNPYVVNIVWRERMLNDQEGAR